MTDRDCQDMARIFRALSVEKRVEIVRLLAQHTLCVGAVSNILGITAGAVSQHLRVLRDAGLVEPDRRGYFTHYHLSPDACEQCRSIINALFDSKKEAEDVLRKGKVRKARSAQRQSRGMPSGAS